MGTWVPRTGGPWEGGRADAEVAGACRAAHRASVSDSERGQPGASDPVTISPAGSYVPITTPVVETLLSTSFNPEGIVPSENRSLPDPMTRGKTHRRYWSTRLWRTSVWIKFPLPCPWGS